MAHIFGIATMCASGPRNNPDAVAMARRLRKHKVRLSLREISARSWPRPATYEGRWFWIAATDIESKYTSGIIMLLFSIADTGGRGSASVVTILQPSK
jgi:hypothetical protein